MVLEANGYEILGRTQKLQSKSLAEAEQGLNDYELAKRLYGRHDIMSRHSRAGECVPYPSRARPHLLMSRVLRLVFPIPCGPSEACVSHVPACRLSFGPCHVLCRKFKYLSGNMNLAHQYLDTDRKRWKAEEDKRKAREDMVKVHHTLSRVLLWTDTKHVMTLQTRPLCPLADGQYGSLLWQARREALEKEQARLRKEEEDKEAIAKRRSEQEARDEHLRKMREEWRREAMVQAMGTSTQPHRGSRPSAPVLQEEEKIGDAHTVATGFLCL